MRRDYDNNGGGAMVKSAIEQTAYRRVGFFYPNVIFSYTFFVMHQPSSLYVYVCIYTHLYTEKFVTISAINHVTLLYAATKTFERHIVLDDGSQMCYSEVLRDNLNIVNIRPGERE